MKKNRIHAWIAAVAFVVGATAVHSVVKANEFRLQVKYSPGNNCWVDSNNNWVLGEARGYNIAGAVACEAMTQGSTASAHCPLTILGGTHEARITTRKSGTLELVSSLAQSSARAAWTTQSTPATATPAGCSSAVQAVSQGFTLNTGP